MSRQAYSYLKMTPWRISQFYPGLFPMIFLRRVHGFSYKSNFFVAEFGSWQSWIGKHFTWLYIGAVVCDLNAWTKYL